MSKSKKTLLKEDIKDQLEKHGLQKYEVEALLDPIYQLAINYGKYQRIAGTKKFIEMAEEMRQKQKSFFNGDKSVIQEAKKREKKFDEAIAYVKKHS